MFRSELEVRDFTVDDEWVVLQDLVWRCNDPDVPEDCRHVTVPRGFITDFASIPRLLRCWPAFSQNGRSRKPGVLHDYLYCAQTFSRADADTTFRMALAAAGVSMIVRWLFWSGVRVGGWIYFNKRGRDSGLGREDFVGPGYWKAHP